MNKYELTNTDIFRIHRNSLILQAKSFVFKFNNEPAFKVKWCMFAIALVTCTALINEATHTDEIASSLISQIHQDAIANTSK